MISVAAKTRDGHWRLFFYSGTASYFTDFFCTSHLFGWLFLAQRCKKNRFSFALIEFILTFAPQIARIRHFVIIFFCSNRHSNHHLDQDFRAIN